MFLHGGLNDRSYFLEKLTELGLRHGSAGGATSSASHRARYIAEWQSGKDELTQALKGAYPGIHARYCGYIFFIVIATQELVSGLPLTQYFIDTLGRGLPTFERRQVYDEPSRRMVVGHLTTHLPNSLI